MSFEFLEANTNLFLHWQRSYIGQAIVLAISELNHLPTRPNVDRGTLNLTPFNPDF